MVKIDVENYDTSDPMLQVSWKTLLGSHDERETMI